MPHLMNCPHSPDSWCLSCVKVLWEEKYKLEEFIHKAMLDKNITYDNIRASLEELIAEHERNKEFFNNISYSFVLE